MAKIRIDGILFEDLSPDALAERLLSRDQREPQWVVTPNAIMLEAARRDGTLRTLLTSASVAVADGRGVQYAALRQGQPRPRLLPGIVLGEAVLLRAARESRRVFLLGGKDGVAATAAERLRERYPGLLVCGHFWGYFGDSERERSALLSQINATRPEILFVCLGFPRQELWIKNNLPSLPSVRLAIGLGGSLDVWAGRTPRAPRLVRALAMEWAWRMLHQPKKLKLLPALLRFTLQRGGEPRLSPPTRPPKDAPQE